MARTSMGLEENIAGLLCCALGWITGIVFLVLEKENKFVRFHAMQSLVTFLPLSLIASIGWAISSLVGILALILWLVMMFKAYQGEMYKLPIVGDFAEKQIE